MIRADLLSWHEAATSDPARRVEIEIGCGNGHFLCDYGARNADALLLGIDLKKKRSLKAREKAAKRGLSNVFVIQGSAEETFDALPFSSVDAFHIYFPDPWPKSRHRKRRFFTMDKLNAMHDRLKDGGKIYFGTDFFDYYMQAKVLVVLHSGFSLADEPAPPEVLSSLYGQRFAEARKAIHLFSAVKRASTDELRQRQEHQGNVHREVQADEGS